MKLKQAIDNPCPFQDLPPVPSRDTLCERGLEDTCEKFGSPLDTPFKAGPNGRDEPFMVSTHDPFEKTKQDI